MVALHLTARGRDALAEYARHATDARVNRRALALLVLAAGDSPTRVAERYRVSRSTVYEWAARWGSTDAPGRPPAGRRPLRAATRHAGRRRAGPG